MNHHLADHAVRDDYPGGVTWSDAGFCLRCRPRRGQRTAYTIGLGSWGLLLTLPTGIMLVADGLAQRGAMAGVVTFLLGWVLLYVAARGTLNSVTIEGDADAITVRMAPLAPTRARRFETAHIEHVVVERRPVMLRDHLATRRSPDPASMPFRVRVVLRSGAQVPLQLSMSHGDAARLSNELLSAIQDAKLRRAEASGFRG